MHHLRRTFRRHLLCKPAEDGSDLGGAPDTSTSTATVTDTPVDTGAVVADVSKPTTMLEAMTSAIEPAAGGLDAAGQPRDPLGRFAPKNADGTPATPPVDAAAKTGAAPAAAPAAPGAVPPAAPAADDLTAMPEGLTPKAQERFQKLANANRELSEWRAQVEPQVNAGQYVQETFQTNGIKREQFETFVEFAGALNRGDLATVQRIMEAEMQNIALLTGQPLTADPLASHPDLREAVNGFQMTEAHALETARYRTQQAQQQAQAQQHQQAQQTQQQAQQEVQRAEQQIDQLMNQLQSNDIDYAAVMPHLEQAIKDGLLTGVKPHQWASKLQVQYQLIKKVAGSQRTVQPATPVLRPTGVAAPGQQPKSMLDAMFPSR